MISEKNMMHGIDYLNEDVAGWLMSEKLDGCRAYWDGSVMWSRGGKVVAIPQAMRAALPDGVVLDGEIHAGRGGFEIARQAVQYNRWVDGIEFSAFDAPGAAPFSIRYSDLAELLPYKGVVNYVPHAICAGYDDALSFMQKVQDCYGGEGVVLRHPDNVYRPGRTDQILKLKEGVSEC